MNNQESAIQQLMETISTLAANLEVCIIDPRGYLFKDKQAETTSQKRCLLESQGKFGVLEASCLSKDAQICSLKVDKKRLEVSLFLILLVWLIRSRILWSRQPFSTN